MPALSPTMEEGNIVKWLKKEGKIAFSVVTFSIIFQLCKLFCKNKIILPGYRSVFWCMDAVIMNYTCFEIFIPEMFFA